MLNVVKNLLLRKLQPKSNLSCDRSRIMFDRLVLMTPASKYGFCLAACRVRNLNSARSTIFYSSFYERWVHVEIDIPLELAPSKYIPGTILLM